MNKPLNRTAEQFWANVEKAKNGCWLWRGGRKHAIPKRYPHATVNGKTDLVHRLAYTLAKGIIPPGLLVLHSCDNPRCLNPDHLSIGTNQDNADDMVKKGRSTRDRKRPGTGPAGARNPKAKLTPAIVKQIREDRRLTGLSVYKIAAKYGIGKSQAYNIISNTHWKDIA
jgi:hypothetical protein